MRSIRMIFVLLAMATLACRCSFDFGDDNSKPPSTSYSNYSPPEPPNPVKQFQNNLLITPGVVMIIAAIYMWRSMTVYKNQPKNGSYVFWQFVLPIGSVLLCAYQYFFPGLAPTGILTFIPSGIGGAIMLGLLFLTSGIF